MPPRVYRRRPTVAAKPGPRRADYFGRHFGKVPTGRGMKVVHRNQNALLHTPLMPLSRMGRLPYSDNGNFTTGVVSASGYIFSCNGLYDPNITGTGHQPMGFDQLMLFYEHYCVTRAKITVNFYNTSATDDVVVGILIAPDATLATNTQIINENGMLVKKLLGPTSDSNHFTTLTITANVSKINGKKDVRSEDDFRGDVAANPTEQSYFHLFGYDLNAVAQKTIKFECLIEYTAQFTEPRKMIQS